MSDDIPHEAEQGHAQISHQANSKGVLYRCGELNALTSNSLASLPRRVGLIVDLRSRSERDRAPEPVSEDEDGGIAMEQLTEEEDEALRPEAEKIMQKMANPSQSNAGNNLPSLEESYADILKAYKGVFERVIRWIATQSGKEEKERMGVLFHCTG